MDGLHPISLPGHYHTSEREMSLHVLAYNLKRVMKILGIKGLMDAMSEWKSLENAPLAAIITTTT